jgi:hypothetical protein
MQFNRLFQNLMESITDKDYLEAIDSGDMTAVQKMVDDSADDMGYNVGPVYHSTDNTFTQFNPAMIKRYSRGRGFYFSKHPQDTKVYGKKLLKVFLSGNVGDENDLKRQLYDKLSPKYTAGYGMVKYEHFDDVDNDSDKAMKLFNELKDKTSDYYHDRAKPVFLENDDKIAITKFMLQRDFAFNDAIFSNHILHYSAHQIIENKLRPNTEKSIINVFYAWGYGYYHFLTEVLPNILDINKPHDIFLNYCKVAEPILRWFNVPNNIVYESIWSDYKRL